MVFGMDFRDGLPGAIAVARDGCDRRRSVAHRVTGQAQTRHWILVVPAQQYPLGRVGMACAGVRARRAANRTCHSQFSGRLQERA